MAYVTDRRGAQQYEEGTLALGRTGYDTSSLNRTLRDGEIECRLSTKKCVNERYFPVLLLTAPTANWAAWRYLCVPAGCHSAPPHVGKQ